MKEEYSSSSEPFNRYHLKEPTITMFGIDIHPLKMSQTLDVVHECITSRQSLHIGMLNAAKIVNMQKNPALRESVTSSNLILADGSAVVTASKVLNKRLPERVAGIDLMYGIMERGNKSGYRVFCLGATEAVSEEIERQITKHYPGLVIAGRQNGYFSDEQQQQVAENIAQAKADVLFVAITSPKKEQFMAKWGEVMRVPVVHGVGGSFDVFAGKVKRAPLIWQKMGMEWFYRVLQEPKRLWKRYLITNTLFIWMLIKELLKPVKS
ncbi:WecB/TagA/CpsF family glycosyltransferase [Psychromonas sp. 14N.309.X.WAT.B.A12]|uniref:WecB/TagA/CpsF family glycosyltransferase n=2 Tax=Psychromonas TaxID=67572 RepID=UPI0025B0C9E0|nr:WecB/TagA/CpsF family glycosyltransferase [Psychromonas sp. 14N.309.X.WAT.B.A12]MDN2662788.1 WecB/TagA/CpsF family glycosyltransferase [Psychromonas sp. 14N.309.X.WAT.B.A12]